MMLFAQPADKKDIMSPFIYPGWIVSLISSLLTVEEEEEIPGVSGLSTSEVNAMPKQVLVGAAALAQIASGASLADVEHSEVDFDAEAAQVSAGEIAVAAIAGIDDSESADLEAVTSAAFASLEAGGTPEEAQEAALAALPAVTPDEPEAPEVNLEDDSADTSSLVSFLKSELKEARADLAAKDAELTSLKTTASADSASVAALKPIAIEATQRMQVAMGQPVVAMEGFTPDAVCQQYNPIKEAFNARFKVGKQSLGADASAAEKPADGVTAAKKLGIVPKA